MVYRCGILCKLREKPVIARDYKLIPSKIVGINDVNKEEHIVLVKCNEINHELLYVILADHSRDGKVA